jgi:hypothetical protein
MLEFEIGWFIWMNIARNGATKHTPRQKDAADTKNTLETKSYAEMSRSTATGSRSKQSVEKKQGKTKQGRRERGATEEEKTTRGRMQISGRTSQAKQCMGAADKRRLASTEHERKHREGGNRTGDERSTKSELVP